MLARKGRASYLGERSVGHQDPGATSVALLLQAAAVDHRLSDTGADHDIGTGVGIVVVSHSRALADGRASAWPARCCTAARCRIEVAAGLDEHTFGTDARAGQGGDRAGRRPGGVVVLMDLGSAVLSAELALDLLDDDARARVVLSSAPIVEGLIVAAVAAAGGASRAEVAAEAASGLRPKLEHLGQAEPAQADAGADGDLEAEFTIVNDDGLHARPAAVLVATVRRYDAEVTLRCPPEDGPSVSAGSLTDLMTMTAAKGPGGAPRERAAGAGGTRCGAVPRGTRLHAGLSSYDVSRARTCSPASGSTTTSWAAATPSTHRGCGRASHVALDQRQRDRAELVVAGRRADEADRPSRRGARGAAGRAAVVGAVEVQQRQPARRTAERVHAGDGLLAAVAALVEVHRRADPADLVGDRAVVGVEAEPRLAARDPQRLVRPDHRSRVRPPRRTTRSWSRGTSS